MDRKAKQNLYAEGMKILSGAIVIRSGTLILLPGEDYGAKGCYILADTYAYKNGKPLNETNSILIQTDWDYPGAASNLGYDPCSDCCEPCKGETDGTVDCSTRTAGEMISEAREFLDDHLYKEFEDPGYLGGNK